MFCEIEINMSPVEDETARLGGFKNHWRSWLKTIPIWLIHHFSSWAERLNPPTNDKDKTARPWLRLCQMVGHFSRSCKGPRINGQKLNRHRKCRLESRWGAMFALFMQIYVYRKDYGNFRGDAGCSGHHSYVYQIHSGRCAHVPVQSFQCRVSRAKSRVQYWWLLFMEANRFDQVIPAINGVSIAVQEDSPAV